MDTLLEGLKKLASLTNDPIVQALGDLPWDGGRSIQLVFFQDKITLEQMRRIKKHCGPLEYRDDGSNKDARGSIELEGHCKIKVVVYNAMTCTPMEISDEDGPTLEQMAVIVNKIHSGELKVVDCKQADFAEECITPGCKKARGRGTQCPSCVQEQGTLEDSF